jgi:hypothetical protein
LGEAVEDTLLSFQAFADDTLLDAPSVHKAVLAAAKELSEALDADAVKAIRAWGHVGPDGTGHVNITVTS